MALFLIVVLLAVVLGLWLATGESALGAIFRGFVECIARGSDDDD